MDPDEITDLTEHPFDPPDPSGEEAVLDGPTGDEEAVHDDALREASGDPVDESAAPFPEVAQAEAAETQAVPGPVDENVEATAGTGPPPRDQRLPFPVPPFDFAAALHRIAEQNREVTAAREAWEAAKEEASSCRKAYEREAEELEKLIRELESQEKDADRRQAAPLVGYIAEGVAAGAENAEAKKPGCAFERETGQPCPICRDSKPGHETRDDPVNPLHPMHEQTARERADCEALQAALREDNVFLDFGTIYSGMTAEQRGELLGWSDSIPITAGLKPSPPAWFHPHEAAEPGGERQTCRACGCTLWDAAHQLTWRGSDRSEPYPVGSLVDNDCEGEPEQEEARPIKKRGSKKGRKKHEPEAVAKEQTAAAEVGEEAGAQA